jgi:pPIWI RE three-gene island domain Z
VVQTARVLLGDVLTKRAVQSAVAEFLSVSREDRSFDINEDTLVFRARSEYDPAITRAGAVLREGIPIRTRTLT